MQYKIGGRIKENIWRNQNRYFISTFREKFRYPKDNFSRTRVDFGYNVLPKVTIYEVYRQLGDFRPRRGPVGGL